MKNFIFLIYLILVVGANSIKAQELIEVACTPSHQMAYDAVKYFLTSPTTENERIESGTENTSIEQIRHLENAEECVKLDSIIRTKPKFTNLYKDRGYTRFFYETNDFYYVFWRYLNSKEVKIFGPRSIFIIVNKNTETIYTCYI